MPARELPLEQWTNFYVVTSTAAATLLGLLFVVITLAADRRRRDAASIRIYLTPAVISFGGVLLMSALLIIPNHTRLSTVICICLVSLIGLAYSGWLAIGRGAGSAQYIERADLFPYVVLPSAANGLMGAGGLLFLQNAQFGLDLVAVGMLVLLGIAIRNSWAIAVTLVSSQD